MSKLSLRLPAFFLLLSGLGCVHGEVEPPPGEWAELQRRTEDDLRRRIVEWKRDHATATAAERLVLEDLECRLEMLQKAQKSYEDPEPYLDGRRAFDQRGATADGTTLERASPDPPPDLAPLVSRLHELDDKDRKTRLPEVVASADAVIAAIRRGEVTPARRPSLIDALYRKGRALAYMELPDVVDQHPIADPAAHDSLFEANFAALRELVDTTDREYFLLHVRRERRKGRYGKALELLDRHIRSSPPRYLYLKKRKDLYELLGWHHWWEYEKKWLRIRFPAEYDGS